MHRRCVLLLLTACGAVEPAKLEADASSCPERPGGRFAVGVNAYYLQEEAARSLRRGERESAHVEETFRKARALDLVLARAEAHGLMLVLPLGNSWNDYGGARQYVEWAGLAEPREGDGRFFTDRSVVDHYREHVRVVLTRVNTFDGRRYGEHPAVWAWELLNEPRAGQVDPAAYRAGGDEGGGWVKSLAPAARVGAGEEGFSTEHAASVASPAIDVVSAHLLPESWGWEVRTIAAEGARWIRERAEAAAAAGKVMVLGEFGLRNSGAFTLEERRAIYRGWLACARASGVAVAAPWLFAYDARAEDWDMHTFYFRDGTEPADPVNRHADLLVEAAR